MDRALPGGGFSVLDGVAIVTGAAVASVHVRLAVTDLDEAGDWLWASLLFTWLAVSAAGPFVFLVRRFATRPEGYPRLGDRLWVLSGLPWVLAAVVRTGDSPSTAGSRHLDPAYVAALTLGLALVALISVPVLASKFLLSDPSRPRANPKGPLPWTDRLGLFLAVAWPIQLGVGLIVMN